MYVCGQHFDYASILSTKCLSDMLTFKNFEFKPRQHLARCLENESVEVHNPRHDYCAILNN